MRSTTRIRSTCVPLGAGALLGILVLAGCRDVNEGRPPPPGDFFFPQGLLLDPRADPCDEVRYLLVANGNNDRRFNSGEVVAVDLDAFFRAWAEDPDNGSYEVYPWCEDQDEVADGELARCVLEPGSLTDATRPCRRLPLQPRIVECEEGPFFAEGPRSRVLVGDFATVMAASGTKQACGDASHEPKLWLPVRGEPSITWMEVEGDCRGDDCDPPAFACGQRDGSCDDDHRLTRTRNDPDAEMLYREPYNVFAYDHAWNGELERYVFVAHTVGPFVTIIDVDGLVPTPGDPVIVQQAQVFGANGRGGFGLAARPCRPPDPEDPEDLGNAPVVTQNCKYPLVYASTRYSFVLSSFIVGGMEREAFDPSRPGGGTFERKPENLEMLEEYDLDTCTFEDRDGEKRESFRFCGTPKEIEDGERCAVSCEPQVLAARQVLVPGLDPTSPSGGPVFGDIAFADATGDTLYVLQTTPGALIRVDTSLDENGRPHDRVAGPPVEICNNPSRMKLWQDAGLAFISCFRAALVYVVDLRANRVIESITTGTGPHDLALDPVRKMLYVANTLEGSVSVIHVDPEASTRFQEIARIGLQEPFSE